MSCDISMMKLGVGAPRVAMGALLFTILGVALDVTSFSKRVLSFWRRQVVQDLTAVRHTECPCFARNIITVFSTKRDMAEVEDEAAQVGDDD